MREFITFVHMGWHIATDDLSSGCAVECRRYAQIAGVRGKPLRDYFLGVKNPWKTLSRSSGSWNASATRVM